jgi:hypothetical protein
MEQVLFERRGRSWPHWTRSTGVFVAAGALAVLPVSVAFTHVQPAPLEWIVVALPALASLLAILIGVVNIVSLERVVIDGSEVKASRDIGPLRLGWSVSLAEITSLQVPGLGRQHAAGTLGHGIRQGGEAVPRGIAGRGRPVVKCSCFWTRIQFWSRMGL